MFLYANKLFHFNFKHLFLNYASIRKKIQAKKKGLNYVSVCFRMGTQDPQTKKCVFLYQKKHQNILPQFTFSFSVPIFCWLQLVLWMIPFPFLPFISFQTSPGLLQHIFQSLLKWVTDLGSLALTLPWTQPLPPGQVGCIHVGSLIKSAITQLKATGMYLQQTSLHINKYSTVWCIMPCIKIYITQLVLPVYLSYTQ